ncbi:hypothetical protein GOP47_0001841 [Adiantum capillus-veneris]|uniref:Uncharacterized protein n=1 Tax=Adiantum capillus-veneris TaxID=13818 RepID=A0A9D4VAH5_ADICA|nr:hypothetical protein GOP47_0001841 [Adiantum capillus-veneris]
MKVAFFIYSSAFCKKSLLDSHLVLMVYRLVKLCLCEGGVAMYVATRGLYKMKPPTVIVPKCIKETVEKLFEVYKQLDGSELKHNLIGLDVGETYDMGKGLRAKAFKTYHVIPSQGYLIYSVRHKLKAEYLGLPGKDIKNLKDSGVEVQLNVFSYLTAGFKFSYLTAGFKFN